MNEKVASHKSPVASEYGEETLSTGDCRLVTIMQPISGISSIISGYDAILMDLWGVVHDGSQLYPGVHEVLSKLRQADKKIIMLSNAPRRAYKAEVVLKKLGLGPELYDHVLTSGEMGYRALRDESPHLLISSSSHPSYYYIGPAKDADVLDGLDYRCVRDVGDADFLLNVGFGSEEESSENWQDLLSEAQARGLPMLCLNPDFEVVKITGERYACAGVLAADYERMGGAVTYFGKPFPEVYERCLEFLFPSTSGRGQGEGSATYSALSLSNGPHPALCATFSQREKEKVLAIGDGIATDIAGAVDFGIDAVLVTGGIIKKSDNIEELCRKHNAMPKYVMPRLVW